MDKKKTIAKLFLCSILMLCFLSSVNASSNYVDQELKPENITFVYFEDDVEVKYPKYKGDLKLRGMIITNSVDHRNYYIDNEFTRRLAYLTKSKFNILNETFIVKGIRDHNGDGYQDFINGMKYANGTEVSRLGISTEGLNNEEISYFHDYEDRRKSYFATHGL